MPEKPEGVLPWNSQEEIEVKMTAVIENEAEFDPGFDKEELFRDVIEAVIEEESCPYDVSVSLLITDNAAIRELNRETRGTDSETDVLSFPMLSFSAPSYFDDMEEGLDNFDPDTGELLLGDIVISGEKVIEQAKSYGHSVKREYAFLIVHSLLHLMGYDHMEDGDRELMEGRQKCIMERLSIMRD